MKMNPESWTVKALKYFSWIVNGTTQYPSLYTFHIHSSQCLILTTYLYFDYTNSMFHAYFRNKKVPRVHGEYKCSSSGMMITTCLPGLAWTCIYNSNSLSLHNILAKTSHLMYKKEQNSTPPPFQKKKARQITKIVLLIINNNCWTFVHLFAESQVTESYNWRVADMSCRSVYTTIWHKSTASTKTGSKNSR